MIGLERITIRKKKRALRPLEKKGAEGYYFFLAGFFAAGFFSAFGAAFLPQHGIFSSSFLFTAYRKKIVCSKNMRLS